VNRTISPGGRFTRLCLRRPEVGNVRVRKLATLGAIWQKLTTLLAVLLALDARLRSRPRIAIDR
jgi:hypothetical protein